MFFFLSDPHSLFKQFYITSQCKHSEVSLSEKLPHFQIKVAKHKTESKNAEQTSDVKFAPVLAILVINMNTRYIYIICILSVKCSSFFHSCFLLIFFSSTVTCLQCFLWREFFLLLYRPLPSRFPLSFSNNSRVCAYSFLFHVSCMINLQIVQNLNDVFYTEFFLHKKFTGVCKTVSSRKSACRATVSINV